MNNLKIRDGKIEINGELIAITLEMANKLNPCEINDEFFSSESDIEWVIENEKIKLGDKNNTILSDEERIKRIANYMSLLTISRAL